MATIIVYRSRSASYAANRVAKAAEPITAMQEDAFERNVDEVLDVAVVRWDCHKDLGLPSTCIDVNPHAAVVLARDKAASRRILAELSPPTWTSKADIQVPCVIRPRTHKAGKRFHVVRETSGILRAVKRCGPEWYASQLIDKAREFRVFVVQGRVAAVSERFGASPTEIAWNIARGGRLINVERTEWPINVIRTALEAMRRLGLGFGAVDVCICTQGRAWVFEANTSPALRNKYTIKKIAQSLAMAATPPKPVKEGAQKPRSYAHPATLPKRER